MGGTCTGKSTLVRTMKTLHADRVAVVNVGDKLRKKYLDQLLKHYEPDKFKGKGNPDHMTDEALELYRVGVFRAVVSNPSLIIVDGQPRTNVQAAIIGSPGVVQYNVRTPLDTLIPVRNRFMFMHAMDEVRRERLEERHNKLREGLRPGQEVEHNKITNSLKLGQQRIINDDRDNLETLIHLQTLSTPIAHLDTSDFPLGQAGIDKMESSCYTLYEMMVTEPE